MFEKIKSFLFNRQKAYQLVFDKDSLAVKAVLEDLAAFCRAHKSTFHSDPRAHGVLEGRREVWLRIQHHLELNSEELWKLYMEGKKQE